MTADGALLHRITSPKAMLPKIYDAVLDQELRDTLFKEGEIGHR